MSPLAFAATHDREIGAINQTIGFLFSLLKEPLDTNTIRKAKHASLF